VFDDATIVGVLFAFTLAAAAPAAAQRGADATPASPFKLGTFEIGGTPRIGLVLQDSVIVELDAANRALERDLAYPRLAMPETMRALISQYEYGLKLRLYEIVNDVVRNKRAAASPRPPYIYDVKQVRTLAPLMPGKMLMAAVNFYSHVGEGGTPEEQKKALETRRAARGIPASKAQDHVFGYMVTVDISDRGGRPPGGFQGVDWFVGKGHDTFGPVGPWIVPKEFYGDPMKSLRQTLSVGGQQMQEGQPGDMIHSTWELIEYASSIVTLFPGDVVNAGTSGGVGMGTAVRGKQMFLKAGDVITAAIDGIGTLTIPVVAGPKPPDGTGAYLPPVISYRKPQQ
jgi:2-keto-4-pentenoate hydratase/2-oxohepta-3-ene-1,7-dioic acid hydratase in catechol pathway